MDSQEKRRPAGIPSRRQPVLDTGLPPRRGLYDPQSEHDSCGVGFIADLSGRPSHRVLDLALESVINLTHRGAVDADAKTGDGAGVLTQVPRRLFAREAARLGHGDVHPEDIGVAMVFLPRDGADVTARCRSIIKRVVKRHGLRWIGWRTVPVQSEVLGEKAAATQPDIRQLLLGRPLVASNLGFERTLYLARKEIERRVANEGIGSFYIPSMSHRTIVYKGLFVAPQLRDFYLDFRDPAFETALALFHQRYSTNTFPTWPLAQPFRQLGHNGEINTLQGNRNWMAAREAELASPVWREQVEWLKPICVPGGSDSASLDNALEAIELSGRDILHAMLLLVPEAWENMPDLDPTRRAFYAYHAALTEPWDGPAALAFTDGTTIAATLDRNGLRPARYQVLRDGLVVMASEVGVIAVDDAAVVEKGRLGPGEMIAVDTARQELLRNDQIKDRVARHRPYGEWVARSMMQLEATAASNGEQLPGPAGTAVAPADGVGMAGNGHEPGDPALVAEAALPQLWRAFGYTAEDLQFCIEAMGADGKDAVWSMGDDTPLAVLSQWSRPLYNYFRQRFAQVTNPPIDSLRESLVMSLNTYVGRRRNLFDETEDHARLVHLHSPILLDHEAARLCTGYMSSRVLSTVFPLAEGAAGLQAALDRLRAAAVAAVEDGVELLILSDKAVDETHAPIPGLLALGAVHHHLIREELRMRCDLVVETGDAWDIHHFACLLGYGAAAVYPYLALASVRRLVRDRRYTAAIPTELMEHFRKAVDQGLLKIMSKMGISTLSSYRGAQIFEAVGVAQDLTDACFTGTPSPIGGIGLAEIADVVLRRHAEAWPPPSAAPAKPLNERARWRLPNRGFVRFRREGEYHGYNRLVVQLMQQAALTGDPDDYRRYTSLVYDRPPAALRDLLEFRSDRPAISVDGVEPASAIVKRFNSTAMSLGSLSPEAHRTLAIAMNRLGTRSNTGEGGEDPDWWQPLPNGDWANSKIKQVASARFGVTPQYLSLAQELEIKMAQGSKPGEGGQIPAHKVTRLIARLRHAIPGIPLFSPPPHHDIYSIEDLAQLIYDLKIANPRARVGVKLVAETGVGTIAAGVAKAYADYVLISGHDGGTGASPLSSIKNAGVPWEIGLSETQQVLVMNDLRGRIRVRTDGGLKTGRDLIVAALLGAEEYGFGTAALVAIGCDMARQCHLNTCPTGVATQREDLRAKFRGTPDMVVNYFTLVASEVREILASLGYRSVAEIVGRTDLLRQRHLTDATQAPMLDLSEVLQQLDPEGTRPRRCLQERNDRGDTPLDDRLLRDAESAIETGQPFEGRYAIRNHHRTVGARLSGAIATRYGDTGLPPGTVRLNFAGTAGQSFGAFLAPGVHLTLAGEANDYVGKGMGGGEIVIRPAEQASFAAGENTIVGNTVLYGATSGALFVAGRAGERFAVRNSGASAVVEGVGDHCCEYMTGGMVVVLGKTGRNFAAGMSHGVAYVLDETSHFPSQVNREMVELERVESEDDEAALRTLISRHYQRTESRRAEAVLARWPAMLPRFWRVVPRPAQVETETAASRVTSVSGSDAVELQRPAPARRS